MYMNKMTYKCNFCEHDFKQKVDLDRHIKKKNGCILINKIIDLKEQQTINNGKISELHSLFKTCLDILRNDAEHLIGDEALNELSHFLILKQLEKHIINNSIDIYNLELYHDGIKKYGKEKFIEQLEYIKFTKLVEYIKITEKENNIKNIFDNFLWKEILSKHPKFKDVFEDGKKSFIKESSTIKKIIIALSNIDFDNYEHDILGEAYERIFVDAVFGAGGNKKSEMGQFFTSPKVKNLLVSLVNPKVKENGEIESVLDPSSGTGGILNTVIKYFKKNNQISNEDLRKQLIKNIYGIEIKGKIYNLCLSNMLINTGEILPNVICADSIRKFHNIKVDTIIANPPFSVSISYDELLSSLGSVEILDDYIPIKAGGKNSEVLFLQMMIHCLNINGRCATVMLDGQKMYGSSSRYDKIREYLMKSCDLHEVILCPAGTFTSTASKTCILFFTKKKERKDVLEIKGSKRELIFSKVHSTKKVIFYDFNPDTEKKHFIKEVDIKEIASNKYSLNYTEYNVEEDKCKDDENIKWLELGDVCEFKNGHAFKSYDFCENGIGLVSIKSIQKNEVNIKKITEYIQFNEKYKSFEIQKEDILIALSGATTGKIGINKNEEKLYLNQRVCILKIKNYNIILNKYIFYVYILSNIDQVILSNASGAAQPNISTKSIEKIKIPLISIEKQNKIVEFLDKLYENKQVKIQDTSSYYENNNIFKLLLDEKYDIFEKLIEWQEQSVELSKQIEFFKNRQERYLYLFKINNDNLFQKLNKVCFINPENIKESSYNNINYIDISCVKEGKLLEIKNLKSDFPSRAKRIIKKGDILYSSVRPNLKGYTLINENIENCIASTGFAQIRTKDINILLPKYIYYIITTADYLNLLINKAKGAQYPVVSFIDFEKIKIPVISIEKQKEIIDYCDNNNNIIKQLENEIKINNSLALNFIPNIINNEEPNEKI